MNVLQHFDDSKMYESITNDEWWDANQWHSIRDQWYLVAASYKNAADRLVDGLPDGLLMGVDRLYIAYPIMFLYRHCIELDLKALLIDLRELANLKRERYNEPSQNSRASLPGHPLMESWQLVKDLLLVIDDEVRTNDAAFAEANAIYDAIEERIKEFNRIDPKSFNFRYPTDQKMKERILAPLPGDQELSHVKDMVEVVANYFGSIATWVHEERNHIIEAWHDY